ncbi:MAG: hypothetical protein JO235_26275 [Chroococcidiopsidaceae cyanobacterium CP_BM_RX_35]|nr:hypothetical protein [Chroococcidiopsidaceae cyanobacterium CP_BM_RX_35]
MVPRKAKAQHKLSEVEQNSSKVSTQVSEDGPASVAETTTVIPEVVEELSQEEIEDRLRLELKVERAVFEAGKALRELRDRRLYRTTHKTFEDYCQERFKFTRRRPYQLIDAADVIENLFLTDDVEDLCTIGTQTWPTNERQVRDLVDLAPEEQRQVWQKAVEAAGGKVPSGRIVKTIVERLKEKPLPQTPLSYMRGDAFILQGLSGPERRYNNCWAIAREILEFSLKVETHDGKLQVKPENLEPIDDRAVHRQLAALLKRIQRLRKFELDRGAIGVLELLGKQTFLTEVEERLLTVLEDYYGIAKH